MKKQNLQQVKNKILALSLVILVAFAVMATIRTTYALNNNPVTAAWSLNLNVQSNNSTTINSNQQATFSPFDLIQITANLTNGNLTAPNTPVVFNVKGPSTSSVPTEITKTSVTNNASSANMTFRIPFDGNEKNVLGTWQVFANVKASNGTLQQKANFQVAWPIQLLSTSFCNFNNQNQTVFAPGDEAQVILTLNANQEQTESIDLNVQDATGKIINQTQIQDVSFNATNSNKISYGFKIPADATFGVATLNVRVFSGTYEGVEVPSVQNITAHFLIGTIAILSPTPNATPTPHPSTENIESLFSWILIATGIFTFTALYMFLRRKPMPKTGTQMSNIPSPTPSQTTTALTQTMAPTTLTEKIATEKTLNETLPTELPSIFQTLEPQSDSAQEQKQLIIDYLTKISNNNERVQALETELKIEKEQLSKDVTGLTKILDEQEKAIRKYFDSIRQEILKLLNNKEKVTNQEKEPTQPSNDNSQENQ